MKNFDDRNLIWIFGGARTGSTWLIELLSYFQGVGVWNEPNILSVYRQLQTRETGDKARKKDYIFDEYTIKALDNFIIHILRSGVDSRFAASGFRRIFLKEVTQSVVAVAASRLTPEGSAIFLWRDPLDVLDSQIDALSTWRKGVALPNSGAVGDVLALEVKNSFEGALLALDRWPNKRSLEVRFEDLLAHTDEQLSRILDFAGIEFDPVEVMGSVIANKFDRFVVTGRSTFRRFGRVRSWELSGNFSNDELAKYEAYFSLVRERLGYSKAVCDIGRLGTH